MGFLDRLLGRGPRPPQDRPTGGYEPPTLPGHRERMPTVDQAVASEDERAIARYRYLLRTAPPEQIEQAHAEAFAQLSSDQRHKVLGQLSQDLPKGEAPRSDDPRDLARAATRAEMRQPGYLTSAFAGPGSMMAGSMLGSIAGVVIGSTIASSVLGGYVGSPEAAEVGEQGVEDVGDPGADIGGDVGGEVGYDVGHDVGGDFGGFGGGDFGGFDF